MRQVNATSVARSLHCTKPQVDQIRKGKGDVTIHTLKGQLVHALFDRMLEGVPDMQTALAEVLPSYLVQLASVTDEFFDEEAFRADVLRHTSALKEFVDRNPQLLEHTQLELKRYSATIGIQGRIDAVFREGNRLDILELKTGARIRPEDHAQLFIYRLVVIGPDPSMAAQRRTGCRDHEPLAFVHRRDVRPVARQHGFLSGSRCAKQTHRDAVRAGPRAATHCRSLRGI